MESFYYKVSARNFTEKELHHRCFSLTFPKNLQSRYFQEHSSKTASEGIAY